MVLQMFVASAQAPCLCEPLSYFPAPLTPWQCPLLPNLPQNEAVTAFGHHPEEWRTSGAPAYIRPLSSGRRIHPRHQRAGRLRENQARSSVPSFSCDTGLSHNSPPWQKETLEDTPPACRYLYTASSAKIPPERRLGPTHGRIA